ncbi:MAG: glycosyltransferase family 4 protein [Firmicutes bacterium]|nr:glycosyltransferase family 4 protein [Bacillota bacterium]
MKVFVLEFISTVGGVQTVYKNILQGLSNNHTIFFLDPYSNNFSQIFTEIENIKVINMPIKSESSLGWNKGFAGRISILLKYAPEYLGYLKRLIKYVKKERFDTLYVSGKKELFFAYLIKLCTGTPYIYHSHGFAKAKDIGFIYKKTIANADKIICISEATKQVLRERNIDTKNAIVVYNGVDIEKIDAFSNSEDIVSECFKVVYAGVVQPTKGVHTLVEAVKKLSDEEGGISLDIFGEIPKAVPQNYIDELSEMASKSNGAIRMRGYSNNVVSEISKCDLLVLPSQNEGLGMVLLEAMCLKKPVIGSNVGGIPEIIISGENGFLFENKNSADLYEKIKILKNNRELARNMGISGRERVEKLFSLNSQIDSIDRVIKSVKDTN